MAGQPLGAGRAKTAIRRLFVRAGREQTGCYGQERLIDLLGIAAAPLSYPLLPTDGRRQLATVVARHDMWSADPSRDPDDCVEAFAPCFPL